MTTAMDAKNRLLSLAHDVKQKMIKTEIFDESPVAFADDVSDAASNRVNVFARGRASTSTSPPFKPAVFPVKMESGQGVGGNGEPTTAQPFLPSVLRTFDRALSGNETVADGVNEAQVHFVEHNRRPAAKNPRKRKSNAKIVGVNEKNRK